MLSFGKHSTLISKMNTYKKFTWANKWGSDWKIPERNVTITPSVSHLIFLELQTCPITNEKNTPDKSFDTNIHPEDEVF